MRLFVMTMIAMKTMATKTVPAMTPSLSTLTPPNCIDCKFYIPPTGDSGISLPKCAFYKKKQLVEGVDTIDHPYCIKMRLFDEFCGKDGRRFVRKD